MADFARDEELWLRKYVEAWHIATENGYSNRLKYVSPVVGTCRHKLRRKELMDCSNSKKPRKRIEDKENCYYRRWDKQAIKSRAQSDKEQVRIASRQFQSSRQKRSSFRKNKRGRCKEECDRVLAIMPQRGHGKFSKPKACMNKHELVSE